MINQLENIPVYITEGKISEANELEISGLIASAPDLLKENEQLKGELKIEEFKNDDLTAERDELKVVENRLIAESQKFEYKYHEQRALNAELLEALKQVVLASEAGENIPSDIVEGAKQAITKAETK